MNLPKKDLSIIARSLLEGGQFVDLQFEFVQLTVSIASSERHYRLWIFKLFNSFNASDAFKAFLSILR